MSAVDIFGLLVPVTYLVMLGIEALFPARAFPPIRFWRRKASCLFASRSKRRARGCVSGCSRVGSRPMH